MGWDIVAIGLNHNLPIDNPSAIAERLIPLFNSPIDIGYYKDWELDPNTKIIKRRIPMNGNLFPYLRLN